MFTYEIKPSKRFFIRENTPTHQQDLFEKNILENAEVFADAINVFLFEGKRKVQSYELLEADTRSSYKEDGMTIRKLERDVLKRWSPDGKIRAEFGIENQTDPFKNMPLRLYGYDGSRYSKQLRETNFQEEKYPVISIVLNYNKNRWNGPLSLHEALELDEELKKVTPNMEIKVIDMRYLEPETIELLNSDLKFIANFLRCIRLKEALPDEQGEMDHPEEVIGLLCAITKDNTYKKIYEQRKEEKGESNNMCEYLDWYSQAREEKGYKNGYGNGYGNGYDNGYGNGIDNGINIGEFKSFVKLVKNGKFTLEEAAEELNLTVEEFLMKQKEYAKYLN